MDKKWRLTRRQILNRDRGRCQKCEQAGKRSAASDVIRINPSAGNWHGNLVSVCEGHGGRH